MLLADLSNGAEGAGGQRIDAGLGYLPANLEHHDNLLSWDTYRNVYNECPINPPNPRLGNMTCDGRVWQLDPDWWNGGAKWRSGNFECAWDSAGRVQPWTTYNYVGTPPSVQLALPYLVGHTAVDYFPWWARNQNGVPPSYMICWDE